MDTTDDLRRLARNLKRLRAARGVSLSELARRAGVAKGTLSQLELGRSNPTVGTLLEVARALGVAPATLLAGADLPDVLVVRADEGVMVASSPMRMRLLQRISTGEALLEQYDLRIDPGVVHASAAHIPGVREQVFVIAGRLEIGPVDDPVTLGPEDYCSFAADTPHRYAAVDGEVRAVLVVGYPASSLAFASG